WRTCVKRQCSRGTLLDRCFGERRMLGRGDLLFGSPAVVHEAAEGGTISPLPSGRRCRHHGIADSGVVRAGVVVADEVDVAVVHFVGDDGFAYGVEVTRCL